MPIGRLVKERAPLKLPTAPSNNSRQALAKANDQGMDAIFESIKHGAFALKKAQPTSAKPLKTGLSVMDEIVKKVRRSRGCLGAVAESARRRAQIKAKDYSLQGQVKRAPDGRMIFRGPAPIGASHRSSSTR